MKTREELLERLVSIKEVGNHDHTGVVNLLTDLLDDEARESPGQLWVEKLRSLPEPR
jgi:hypothetical protein